MGKYVADKTETYLLIGVLAIVGFGIYSASKALPEVSDDLFNPVNTIANDIDYIVKSPENLVDGLINWVKSW